MALKITTQIGTDKGITSEAYVRIADYQVLKSGSANFRIELFQSEADKPSSNGTTPIFGSQSRNQQIGEILWVVMTKEVESTRTVKKQVEVDVVATEEFPAHKTWTTQDVEETYMVAVPDLSALEEGTIFQFGYSHLRNKLEGLFGAENVIDC